MIPSCILSFNYSTLKIKVKKHFYYHVLLYFFSEKEYNDGNKNEEVFAMAQRYENIMVAVDGSK